MDDKTISGNDNNNCEVEGKTNDEDVESLPRLQDMRQGAKVSPVFTPEEFNRRLSKLRGYMKQNNIGGTILTSYHNVNYFSGFLYCAFGRNYALVVTPDKDITISAGIDGGQPSRRSHGDNITYTDWKRDSFFYAIKSNLESIEGYVGIEFDHVTSENKTKYESFLPTNKLVDIGEATMKMRMIKSEEEIELIKQGARICDIGGATVVQALREGLRSEHEVALAATAAMVKEIATTYPQVELMDTWTWFQSGINTDGAHNPVTSRRVQKGDILSFNCFPMIAGYYTALERTLFFEHVSDEHLRLWNINCEVHKRGIELIKPGTRCCDIAKELNKIYKRNGVLKYRSFGYGHSFGSMCHYYGREKALEIREDIETVLEPGMVVSMEPMIRIPEGQPGAGGYREHDILVVTEESAENITGFPYGPQHNIIKP